MSITKNLKRVKGFSPQQLGDRGLGTANYQRELLMEHRICKIKKQANVTVQYARNDEFTREGRWQVTCTNCEIYKELPPKDSPSETPSGGN